MRALKLIADRKLELADVPPPPPPGEGEVQIRIKAVALNHLDLWGFRGMAFAKRQAPAWSSAPKPPAKSPPWARASPISRSATKW